MPTAKKRRKARRKVVLVYEVRRVCWDDDDSMDDAEEAIAQEVEQDAENGNVASSIYTEPLHPKRRKKGKR